MRALFDPPRRGPDGSQRYKPPLRPLADRDVTCPAGLPIGDGVLCRIEGSYLDPKKDPSSVARFCTGCHEQCPTFLANWRAEQLTRKQLREALDRE